MNLYVKSISKSIKGEKVLDDISYTVNGRIRVPFYSLQVMP